MPIPTWPACQKLELLGRLAALCERVEADFQLLRICRALQAADHERAARAATHPRRVRGDLFERQLDCDLERLGRRRLTAPQVFLAVSLRPPGASGLGDMVGAPGQALRRSLGLTTPAVLSQPRIAELAALQRRCLERIEAFVAGLASQSRTRSACTICGTAAPHEHV